MNNSHQLMLELVERLERLRQADPGEPVEAFFSSPIPTPLWHYTSIAGFEGIISSGTVWATDARHTTDESEFIHAKEIADNLIGLMNPRSQHERQAKTYIADLVDQEFSSGILSSNGTEVFVASFSDAPDLKSQWHQYAAEGTGVALGFDLSRVRVPRELQTAITLAPCIYEEKLSAPLLRAALKHSYQFALQLFIESGDHSFTAKLLRDWELVDRVYRTRHTKNDFLRWHGERMGAELKAAQTITKFDLLRLASHCKSFYFHEEREWRLSLPHTIGTPLTHVEVRRRGVLMDIPYVAHNLFHSRLPITEVMLGPKCDQEPFVRELLLMHEYDIPINRSKGSERRSR